MIVAVFVFIFGLCDFGDGSAIPVWEFLKKEEKTSFLYSVFAKDVEKQCSTMTEDNCLQDTLKYGLAKLKALTEEDLDNLDPYQRGGNNLIWTTLLEGHKFAEYTPEPQPTTTAKPNSYEDDTNDLEFGSEGSASAKIDNVYKVLPPEDFVYKGVINNAQSVANLDDTLKGFKPQVPFGPLVVKVYPDGSPVPEIKRTPQDDDLRQYQLSKIKLPNL